MAKIVYGRVDEHGRISGFDLPGVACPVRAGRYGADLAVGQCVVAMDDHGGDREGVIEEVCSYIQTGPPGMGESNYVSVRIRCGKRLRRHRAGA